MSARTTSLLLGAPMAAWGAYKYRTTRRRPSKQISGHRPSTDESSGAEPWDIGTGVRGYAWHAPDARAVVLLQVGWGDYAERWVGQAARLIPRLLAIGITVYAFDTWGSGHSPGRRGLTDIGRAIADHLAARKALPSRDDLPVFLIGHSLGGLITATSVIRDQRNVAGMVLLSGALKYDVGATVRTFARIGGFILPTVSVPGTAAADVDALTRDPVAAQRLEDDEVLYRGPLPFLTAGGGAKYSQQNFARYPDVDVPVLAVHGTGDEGTDPQGSRELIELIGSSDKTLHMVAGARHSILDDLGADETVSLILDWLVSRLSTEETAAPR